MTHATAPGILTFLIADVRGYTALTERLGDEAGAAVAHAFTGAARAAVHDADGEVVELRGDQIIASFASARNAVRAALDLQGRAAGLEAGSQHSVPIGIGLDAGEAVPVEGGFRGSALNLASRLCAIARSGEILASDAVIHLAGPLPEAQYEIRGPHHLKGFSLPVGVTAILEPSNADVNPDIPPDRAAQGDIPVGGFLGARPDRPLVERDRELENLLAIAVSAGSGHGQTALLTGGAGVGKTRLAQEITERLRPRGYLIATATCYAERQAMPYSPMTELFTTLYERMPESVRAPALSRRPRLARVLTGVLDGDTAQGDEDGDALAHAVADTIEEAAATAPVALFIDDIHWADTSSLELLPYLARRLRASRVLLLATYRDVDVDRGHPLAPVLLTLHRQSLATWIDILPLDRSGSDSLLRMYLGEERVPPAVLDAVFARSEGVPFFVVEIAQALAAERAQGHSWEAVLQDSPIPDQVRTLVEQRLARLADPVLAVLREAAVLGQHFTFDDLLHLSQRDEVDLEALLESACGAGLLQPRGSDTYAFDHALTRETLYAALLPRRRKRLHRTVAEHIEAEQGRPAAERAADLAWHYLRAEDVERGVGWAIAAGDLAEGQMAHADAERQYRAALDLLFQTRKVGAEGSAREANVLERLAHVLAMTGREVEARESLERAARIYARSDRDGEMRVLARLGTALAAEGTPEEGLARLLPYLERVRAGSAARDLWLAASQLYAARGDGNEALRAADRALAAADSADESTTTTIQVARAAALDLLGRRDEAREILVELLSPGDFLSIDGRLQALHVLATSHLRAGELVACRERRSERLLLAQGAGDTRLAVAARIECAEIDFLLGAWDIAVEAAQSTDDDALSAPLRAVRHRVLGEIAVRRGEFDRAAAVIEMAAGTDTAVLLRADMLLSQAEAQQALDSLQPLLTDQRSPKRIDALLMAARAHTELHDVDDADTKVTDAMSVALPSRDRMVFLDALWMQGVVRSRRGAWPEAENLLTAALTLARTMHYPYREAVILHDLGATHMWSSRAQEARQTLTEAHAIFTRLGAIPDAERTARRLSRLHSG